MDAWGYRCELSQDGGRCHSGGVGRQLRPRELTIV
jgi:hypothetical protein